MAVELVNSTQIANDVATPKVLNNPFTTRGPAERSVAKVTVGATASIASIYRFFRVRSGDRVSVLRLANTIGTAGVGRDNDIGLYDIEGGAVVDVNFFAKAVSMVSERATWTELLPGAAAGGTNITPANSETRIWEQLGLSADPMKDYDVAMTVNEANTTLAIVVALQIEVVR